MPFPQHMMDALLTSYIPMKLVTKTPLVHCTYTYTYTEVYIHRDGREWVSDVSQWSSLNNQALVGVNQVRNHTTPYSPQGVTWSNSSEIMCGVNTRHLPYYSRVTESIEMCE